MSFEIFPINFDKIFDNVDFKVFFMRFEDDPELKLQNIDARLKYSCKLFCAGLYYEENSSAQKGAGYERYKKDFCQGNALYCIFFHARTRTFVADYADHQQRLRLFPFGGGAVVC